MHPSTVDGAELGAQKWRDALFLQYGLEPPELTTLYDGCQAKFSIVHALDCQKGGLVTARHNELRYGYRDSMRSEERRIPVVKNVRDNPRIYAGRPSAP